MLITTQSCPFGVKVMSKFKVMSKHERGMIKKDIPLEDILKLDFLAPTPEEGRVS